MDSKSKPQYAFGYEVDDYYTQLSHGRWEVRDGDVTQVWSSAVSRSVVASANVRISGGIMN